MNQDKCLTVGVGAVAITATYLGLQRLCSRRIAISACALEVIALVVAVSHQVSRPQPFSSAPEPSYPQPVLPPNRMQLARKQGFIGVIHITTREYAKLILEFGQVVGGIKVSPKRFGSSQRAKHTDTRSVFTTLVRDEEDDYWMGLLVDHLWTQCGKEEEERTPYVMLIFKPEILARADYSFRTAWNSDDEIQPNSHQSWQQIVDAEINGVVEFKNPIPTQNIIAIWDPKDPEQKQKPDDPHLETWYPTYRSNEGVGRWEGLILSDSLVNAQHDPTPIFGRLKARLPS